MNLKRHSPVLYYVGGDKKLLCILRVSGELNSRLLENKNALFTENYCNIYLSPPPLLQN